MLPSEERYKPRRTNGKGTQLIGEECQWCGVQTRWRGVNLLDRVGRLQCRCLENKSEWPGSPWRTKKDSDGGSSQMRSRVWKMTGLAQSLSMDCYGLTDRYICNPILPTKLSVPSTFLQKVRALLPEKYNYRGSKLQEKWCGDGLKRKHRD